jgi:methionyl-tRNA synthetase
MRSMHNADLCDTLGNLVHRATNLCGKYCDGVVCDVKAELPINLDEIIDTYTTKMNNFELQGGANVAIQAFRDVNGYLQEAAPWNLKGDEHAEKRQCIVRTALECIYALTHLLLPFLPVGSTKIFQKLNTEPISLIELKRDGTNLKVGTEVVVGDVLYAKSISEEEMKDAATASSTKKESHAEAQQRKKEAKAKAMATNKKGQAASDPNQPEFTKIDVSNIAGCVVDRIRDVCVACPFLHLTINVVRNPRPPFEICLATHKWNPSLFKDSSR